MPLPTYRTRIELLTILADRSPTNTCEVGVQQGKFSKEILKRIPSIQKHYLVDLWAQQENYVDRANVSNEEHQTIFQIAEARLKPWEKKLVYLRGYSTAMAQLIPDNSLDFVYIDARHDYVGVREDIEAYWDKLRAGGIMSGHDYLEAAEVPRQDWSLCSDGTVNKRAVKGAVDDFARRFDLQVLVSYKEASWHTWTLLKP